MREALTRAMAFHQAGQLPEAERLYRAILQVQPRHADANHNLGVLAVGLGQPASALPFFRAALDANPHPQQFWYSYVNALQATGRLGEAEPLARAVTRSFPEHGFAWNVLAAILHLGGRNTEALAAAQKAVALSGRFPEVHNTLGAICKQLGRLAEAEASFSQALKLQPAYAEAHSNLGVVLKMLDRLEESEAHCRRALELRPNYPEALINLGATLQLLGRLAEAEAVYREVIALKPDSAEAQSELGNTLRLLGRLYEAEQCCRRALVLNPQLPGAHVKLGCVLREFGRLHESVACFEQALRFRSENDVPALNNRGTVLQDLGRLQEALASYREALAIAPENSRVASNLLLCLNNIPGLSPAGVFAEHQRWGERHGRSRVQTTKPRERRPKNRLRVGYVSGDFREHAVAFFFEPLLRRHDRSAVEVFCYAEVLSPDATTVRLQRLADHWVSTVGLADGVLAQRIADDEIDILVDLAGHTEGSRLPVFAHKSAPVQVSWLGYPNTTGLPAIDYRLVDEVTDPLGVADAFATEKLVRLPQGFLCYTAPASAPSPARAPRGTGEGITFGSFNNPTKLSSPTLEAWASLLRRVPGSRLVLKGSPFNDPLSGAEFLARFGAHGIEGDRVILLGRTAKAADHLAAYAQMDIALDPFPYNGTTTTCEALWMGVPVVTFLGDRHAARVGASLLTQAGLTELVANSVQDYINIAAGLASDPVRLAEYRLTLRERMARSTLCDATGFARRVEQAFGQMWQAHCAQPANSEAEVKTDVWQPTQQERDSLEGLLRAGRYSELAEVARTLTRHFPNDGFGWNVLAVALKRAGRSQDALGPAKKAAALMAHSAEAHNNLGLIVLELGGASEAETNFRRASALEPGQASTHSNLALALRALGRMDEALASAQRAIELDPNLAAAHMSEGLALLGLRRVHEAAGSFRRVIALEPNNVDAHSNLGGTLHDLGRLSEAEASFRKALALAPDYAIGHNNLALILRGQGKVEEAVASYRRAVALSPGYITAHSNLLFCLNYLPGISARELYAEHVRWGEVHGSTDGAPAHRVTNRDPQRRLRVGYVSPDLRRHSVAYFLEPLLREHDRSAVEIFCYAGGLEVDEVTIRLREQAGHWVTTVGLNDTEMAQRVVGDRIDILVDLSGHTANRRLAVFGLRPAPVQVSWLGYPNTTGLRAIDYRLVDDITDPPGVADELSTERLVRLPCGFHCYLPPALSLSAANRTRDNDSMIVFGSFNLLTKLSSVALGAWAEIMERVPQSRLLLKGNLLGDPESSRAFQERLRQHGIDPSRVTLRGWTAKPDDHFALYEEMDIALDPFPYNGTTTTCEALWMGVPVVTLLGDRHAARVGASLLTQVGLAELIGDSVPAYVDIAIKLASDKKRLTRYHETLRGRMTKSSLCDAPAFARKMEAAFREMWEAFCATSGQQERNVT